MVLKTDTERFIICIYFLRTKILMFYQKLHL